MPNWINNAFYEGLYFSITMPLTLGFGMRVQGTRNIPPTGSVLVIANHQSTLDPPLIGLSSNRHLYYLARNTLFKNPIFATMIRSLNAVPITRDGYGKEGLQIIIDLLRQEKAIVIFPEGTRTTDGAMKAFKPGVSLLIKREAPTIVPVGIAGAYQAWPTHRHYPIPSPLLFGQNRSGIAVSVGRPMDGRRLAKMPREEMLRDLFINVQRQVDRAERMRRKKTD